MKTAYILQPGKLGDLIITTPIANFYRNKGYAIKWFIFDNFKNYFDYFDYIKPITFSSFIKNYYSNKRATLSSREEVEEVSDLYRNSYILYEKEKNKDDIFLDISWGFAGSPNKNSFLIKHFYDLNRNWIDLRYYLADVSLKERWNFSWIRNEKKENELLEFVKKFSKEKYGTEKYSICHNYFNNKNNVNLKNQINFSYIKGYEIFDWYKVLINAESIACVDSSLCNLVEVIPELSQKQKIYLGSEEPHYYDFMRNILLNNWNDIYGNKIISDYKGKL